MWDGVDSQSDGPGGEVRIQRCRACPKLGIGAAASALHLAGDFLKTRGSLLASQSTIMAGRNPASAALFMRQCRNNSLLPRNLYRAASTSPYAPSNFNKKYTSPIASPSPQAQLPSNLEGPRTTSPALDDQRLSLPNFLDRKFRCR